MARGDRAWRLVTGVVLAAAATACSPSDGSEPRSASGSPQPERTTSAAPTTSAATPTRPEVEKPVRPDAMVRYDTVGAEAAAQYFLELYPYVYATGDLTEWRAMSEPECKFCQSVSEDASALHDDGNYQVSEGFTLLQVSSRAPESIDDFFAVWVDAKEEVAERYKSDGTLLGADPGGELEFDMALRWTGDNWLVRGVDVRMVAGGS